MRSLAVSALLLRDHFAVNQRSNKSQTPKKKWLANLGDGYGYVFGRSGVIAGCRFAGGAGSGVAGGERGTGSGFTA